MTAYDESPSGTIVMVEVVGNLGGGVVGDVVANRLKQIGVKAIVVDGCTRDVLGCVEHGVPVWSREVSMAGMVPYEVHAEINVPINCGGVLVHPGDLIAADMDGVFVCPQSFAPEAVRLVNEFAKSETKTHEALRKGTTILDSYPSKAKHPIND
jgi:regulator of RNase E activity RraA